jgi:hypothetical protein
MGKQLSEDKTSGRQRKVLFINYELPQIGFNDENNLGVRPVTDFAIKLDYLYSGCVL